MLFYLAVASLVMPSLLVGFGIGLGFGPRGCLRNFLGYLALERRGVFR